MKLYIVLCEGLWWSCLALTGYPALLDSDAKKVLGKKSERFLTDSSTYMLLLATYLIVHLFSVVDPEPEA
jgi:hypothetical protein